MLSFSVHLPFPCSVKHINFFVLKGIYFQLFQEADAKLHSYIIFSLELQMLLFCLDSISSYKKDFFFLLSSDSLGIILY